MTTTIRQASLDDRFAIWKFIEQAYEEDHKGAAQFKAPEKWMWQYAENPYTREPGDRLPIWLAIKDGEVVGQMCAIPANMEIGTDSYCGGWGCDFIVNRKCRGEGIGYKLTQAYHDHFALGVGLSMAESTRRIWMKFDPVQLRPMSIFLYPVKLSRSIISSYITGKLEVHSRFSRALNQFSNFVGLYDVAAAVINKRVRLRRTPRAVLKRGFQANFQEIASFGPETDALSENTFKDYGAIVKRESILLNWRFFKNTQFQYRTFVSYRGGTIKGYIVIRTPHPAELDIANIVDLYAAKDDLETVAEMVIFAVQMFGGTVAGIRCSASAIEVERILIKCGFIKIETMRPLVLVKDPSVKRRVQETAEAWYMTLADQDLDRVRPRV